MEIAALILSIIAFMFSVLQYLKDYKYTRFQETIDAFVELESSTLSCGLQEKDINKIISNINDIEKDDSYINNTKQLEVFLANIEHYAVGINTNVYDIKILNRLAGNYMIKKYIQVKPFIEYKRKNIEIGNYSDEYEKMVIQLVKIRDDCNENLLP